MSKVTVTMYPLPDAETAAKFPTAKVLMTQSRVDAIAGKGKNFTAKTAELRGKFYRLVDSRLAEMKSAGIDTVELLLVPKWAVSGIFVAAFVEFGAVHGVKVDITVVEDSVPAPKDTSAEDNAF